MDAVEQERQAHEIVRVGKFAMGGALFSAMLMAFQIRPKTLFDWFVFCGFFLGLAGLGLVPIVIGRLILKSLAKPATIESNSIGLRPTSILFGQAVNWDDVTNVAIHRSNLIIFPAGFDFDFTIRVPSGRTKLRRVHTFANQALIVNMTKEIVENIPVANISAQALAIIEVVAEAKAYVENSDVPPQLVEAVTPLTMNNLREARAALKKLHIENALDAQTSLIYAKLCFFNKDFQTTENICRRLSASDQAGDEAGRYLLLATTRRSSV